MNKILRNGEAYCDILDYAEVAKVKDKDIYWFGQAAPGATLYLTLYQISVSKEFKKEPGVTYALELEQKRVRLVDFQKLNLYGVASILYDCVSDFEEPKG
jgi:hypothetical protein